MSSLSERVYSRYMSFFDEAERTRRWNVFNDVPWDLVDKSPKDPVLAMCAETFCGVEMYLPDYVAQGINVVRDRFGQAWFSANWGYEESKHTLALREYLLRTGMRTPQQIQDYEKTILGKQWNKPFTSARQMTIYGIIQELTTFVIYKKHKRFAKEKGDELLAAIYARIARDEIAHSGFYGDVTQLELEEDPVGTKYDLAYVFKHFTMPAHDLVPDYENRIELMRSVGIDRGVFIREVWLPVLKRLGLSRHDLPILRDPPSEPSAGGAS
jgi:acyl-[acyl-carrier-protein] desaturase